MRNFNTLIILAVVTIAALLAAVFYQPTAVTPPATDVGLLLPGLAEHLDKVQKVNILHAGEAVTLSKQKDIWTITEKANYPAVKDQIRELLMGLAQARRIEPKTRNRENHAALGLADPDKSGSEASRIELFDQSGKSLAKVMLGKRKPATESGRNDFYALVKDDPQTWLVEGRMPAIGAAGAWLARTVLELERSRIVELTFAHSDGEVLRLKPKAPDQTAMALEGLQADEKLQNDYALDDMADRLALMQMEDVQPVDKLKWPDKPDLQIDAKTKDGLSVKITAAKIDNQIWLRLVAEGAAATEPPVAASKTATTTESTDKKSDADKEAKSTKTPQQEAATLNARWQGWAYTLADWAYQALSKHRTDLVKSKEEVAKDAATSAASATTESATPAESATEDAGNAVLDVPDELPGDSPLMPSVEPQATVMPIVPEKPAVTVKPEQAIKSTEAVKDQTTTVKP